MREIKVKIWSKGGGGQWISADRIISDRNGKLYCDGIRDEYITIVEYVGLKDKNGKEIYEGDIVKSKHYPFYGDGFGLEECNENPTELNYVGVVGIDPDGVYYDVKVVSDRVSGRACGGNLSEIIEHEGFEIIGNIYENPELLEAS